MIVLAYPWLLALLPLPVLIAWLVPPGKASRPMLVVPFLPRLNSLADQPALSRYEASMRSVLQTILLSIIWILAVIAIARPQVVEAPITKQIPVRDMLLAVDLSGSMEAADFQDASGKSVDRLTACKQVLDNFLSHRKGDRVGLIFFGSAPFVQAPFTEDLKVCRQLLDEAQVKMAGPQTCLGDALGLAINVFDNSQSKERVMIMLTDGNDTSSQVPPIKAAQIAKDKGIVVHTISVGDPKAVGEDALDVETLKSIASSTGGIYAHAADRKQLDEIYERLDQMQTRQADTLSFRPRRDVFWWPLGAALVLANVQWLVQLVKVLMPVLKMSGSRTLQASKFET